jgi:hypothetical protein
LTQRIQDALQDKLQAVILYGSAAEGDFTGTHSDYNILVVTRQLGIAELDALAGPTHEWSRKGNPPPLLFTRERLEQSADVFPIELLDMQDAHTVLCGEDVIESIHVDTANLRLQIEHELRGKLITLRQAYLGTNAKPRRIINLMIDSLSSFLVLFRAALRLFQDNVPTKKMDALKILAEKIEFDTGVFETVDALKRGREKTNAVDASALFSRYLGTIEQVVDEVDQYISEHSNK